MLHYHVKHIQKGWVHALPRIHFKIMNTVNASTSYSGFQLHLGRSPWVIPPLIPSLLTPEQTDCWPLISDLIDCLNTDVTDAWDNLLLVKITQMHHANKFCTLDPLSNIGDLVMFLTSNWCHEYKKKGEKRTTKFFPCWDDPYHITDEIGRAHV